MPENQLFKQLCTPEILRVGWHLAQADSRDDFVRDPLGHADFAANLTERLTHLIELIQGNRYRPRHLLTIDIPKSGLSVRPGNVLPIEEASILHAATYLLAPFLDKKLEPCVYSYRLHKKWQDRVKKRKSLFREADVDFPFLRKRTIREISPFDAWYERWPEFERDAILACTQEGYSHLTKTDITAYFENIDLRLLETLIRSLLKREENQLIQLVFRLLDGWTRTTSTGTPIGRGIPQGNEVSSFLGNLYLVPLDRALKQFAKKRDARWFRYVDDVKIFTRSDRDAREAVFLINEALRALHLNLQGSKTRVLSGQTLVDELDNSSLDQVEAAFAAVAKLDTTKPDYTTSTTRVLQNLSPLASRFRQKLPGAVSNLSGKENRLFRRMMTLYGACGRPHFRRSAMAALKELPDLRILKKSLTYLSRLPYATHNDSVGELLSLLEDDQLPFPYQTGMVLETIGSMHPRDATTIASRIRTYAFGSNLRRKRHWLVVQKAIEAVLAYPYHARFVASIAGHCIRHEHPLVRRTACALLMRSAGKHVRESLDDLIHHADHALSRLALYFRRFALELQAGTDELNRIRKSSQSDYVFTRQLPQLYAIAATTHHQVASAVTDCIAKLPSTRSAKLLWHRQTLLAATAWATEEGS